MVYAKMIHKGEKKMDREIAKKHITSLHVEKDIKVQILTLLHGLCENDT